MLSNPCHRQRERLRMIRRLAVHGARLVQENHERSSSHLFNASIFAGQQPLFRQLRQRNDLQIRIVERDQFTGNDASDVPRQRRPDHVVPAMHDLPPLHRLSLATIPARQLTDASQRVVVPYFFEQARHRLRVHLTTRTLAGTERIARVLVVRHLLTRLIDPLRHRRHDFHLLTEFVLRLLLRSLASRSRFRQFRDDHPVSLRERPASQFRRLAVEICPGMQRMVFRRLQQRRQKLVPGLIDAAGRRTQHRRRLERRREKIAHRRLHRFGFRRDHFPEFSAQF